jgi:ribosomal protein S18 acetylase RimI-like enzyme
MALWHAAERLAVERARTLLTLDTAAEDGASGFYENQGFTLAGTIPDLCAEAARRADGHDGLLEADRGESAGTHDMRVNGSRVGASPNPAGWRRKAPRRG